MNLLSFFYWKLFRLGATRIKEEFEYLINSLTEIGKLGEILKE